MINVQLTAEQHATLIAILLDRMFERNDCAVVAEKDGEVEEAAEHKKEARACAELVAVIKAAGNTK